MAVFYIDPAGDGTDPTTLAGAPNSISALNALVTVTTSDIVNIVGDNGPLAIESSVFYITRGTYQKYSGSTNNPVIRIADSAQIELGSLILSSYAHVNFYDLIFEHNLITNTFFETIEARGITHLNIERCRFNNTGNVTILTRPISFRGGVDVAISMTDVNIFNNIFYRYPAGLRFLPSSSDIYVSSDIRYCNNTYCNDRLNSSNDYVLYIDKTGVDDDYVNVTIDNNIFYSVSNSGAYINGIISGLSVDNNCFYGILGGNFPGPIGGGSGNITADPLFSKKTIALDMKLKPLSPCRDAGKTLAYVTNDYYGTARSQNASYDIGATETLTRTFYIDKAGNNTDATAKATAPRSLGQLLTLVPSLSEYDLINVVGDNGILDTEAGVQLPIKGHFRKDPASVNKPIFAFSDASQLLISGYTDVVWHDLIIAHNRTTSNSAFFTVKCLGFESLDIQRCAFKNTGSDATCGPIQVIGDDISDYHIAYSDFTFINNIMIGYGQGPRFRNDGAPAVYESRNIKYNHNTYYNAKASTANVFHMENSDGNNYFYNVDIRNNIFYGYSTQGGVFLSDSNNGGGATIDYNCIYNTVSAYPNGENTGSNGNTSNPLFANAPADDFRLYTDGAAKNAGVTLSTVIYDYFGTARPLGGSYDMGAVETLAVESPSESTSLSPSPSDSPSLSPSSSDSPSLSPSSSESPSLSPSSSESPSLSPSASESPSESSSLSPSASESPSNSPSLSPSISESPSLSPSSSESPSESSSISPSASESPSVSPTPSRSDSPSPSNSQSPSESLSESPSESPSTSTQEASIYYVDASKIPTGNGTSSNPWNYEQMRNYFDPTITTALCDETPTNGDELYVKGIIDTGTSSTIISIGRDGAGINILVKAWDITVNGIWLIEGASVSGNISFIQEKPGKYFNSITFKDFGLLKKNSGVVSVFDLDETRVVNTDYRIKNSMIYSSGDIRIANTEYTDLLLFGCTIYTSGDLYLRYSADNYCSIYDSPIRANNIFEE